MLHFSKLKCSEHIGNYKSVLLYLPNQSSFCETYSGLCPHFCSVFSYSSTFIARSSEGDDRKWKRQMWQSCSRRKNGSAACGSSCQRLIKQKNQGHFSSWAISSEDRFLRGWGIKINLDVHFSWLLSLNQTYLVRGSNRQSNLCNRGWIPSS